MVVKLDRDGATQDVKGRIQLAASQQAAADKRGGYTNLLRPTALP
jgi:hypothetical protein